MAVAPAGTVQTRSLYVQAAKDVPLSASAHAHQSSRAPEAASTANVAVPGLLGDPENDVSSTDAEPASAAATSRQEIRQLFIYFPFA